MFDISAPRLYSYNQVECQEVTIMEIAIRKLGNSAGIILPATLMRTLGLSIGTAVTAEQIEGKLVLTPAVKKRYTASELNAQCNLRAPMPEDVVAWDRAPTVGTEAL